jgi:hypothetical protein
MSDHPILLPVPRRCDFQGGLVVVPEVVTVSAQEPWQVAVARELLGAHRPCTVVSSYGWLQIEANGCDHSSDPEAYALTVGESGVRIIAQPGRAGVQHALRTLAQLLHQYEDALPALRIEDAPVFPVRGVMLDISRDRIPTMVELERLIDQLAGWKINHLQLYVEHTVAYRGHEQVWDGFSPLTFDDLRRLDAHCHARGIQLVANQNCLGHLERWFDHPRYQALAEIAPSQPWDFGGIVTKTGPFSLCPSDAGALTLIEDLLDQHLPHIAAPFVNIGCDEAFDIGQGRSAAEVKRRGRAPVYLDWVAKVCALARKHGKRPMFWADIALEHPEALAALPDDLIGLAWGYEPDAPFARWCEQLGKAGREVWVCPGTSCWRSITGRTTERHANLLAAARDGAAHGARGYLVTAWGDLGHRQQWPITLHALAEGAHRAWSGGASWDHRASALHAFNDHDLLIGQWLDDLGDVDVELRRISGKPAKDGSPTPLRNATALFTDLHKPLDEPWIGGDAAWKTVSERLVALADPVGRGALLPRLPTPLGAELAATLRVAVLASSRARLRRGGLDPAPARARLITNLERIIADHRRLWLLRCRPGGLERSCSHYQATMRELMAVR